MSKAATAGKFSAQRAAYEKDTLNSLRRTLKGSGWRKSGNDLFRSVDNLFLNADIRVHSDAFKSTFSFLVKPMSIDEVFWDVMQMPENRDKPLSFRSSAWFKCPVPQTDVLTVDDESLDASELVQRLIHYADDRAVVAQPAYELEDYTHKLENHEEQIARGNYSVTLFCLYCVGGELDKARIFAQEHVSGSRQCGVTFGTVDKGFFELALDYLGETKPRPKWKFWR